MTEGQTPTRGRRMRAEDRRAQLLNVAAKMLSDPANVGASMDDIAAAAGVTKPVLYRHFPSKRALVGEVLTRGIDRLSEALAEAIVDADSPRQQVEAGFVAFFRFLSEEPGAFDLLFRGRVWNESGFVQELVRFQTGMAESVSLLINVPGMDPAHRRFLGAALVGMCDHAAREWINDGMVQSPEEVAQSLVEMAWFGLRNLQPRS